MKKWPPGKLWKAFKSLKVIAISFKGTVHWLDMIQGLVIDIIIRCNFFSFPLAESPPSDLQITAYK